MPNVNLAARNAGRPPSTSARSDPSSTIRRREPDEHQRHVLPRRAVWNYLACLGTTSQFGTTGPGGGHLLQWAVIGQFDSQRCADRHHYRRHEQHRPSFAEGDAERPTPGRTCPARGTNTVIILDSSVASGNDADGRAIPSCATGTPWNSSISYGGLQFEARPVGHHLLHPTPCRRTGTGRCPAGTSSTTVATRPSPTFHVARQAATTRGGVERRGWRTAQSGFIRDSIDFPSWQAMGTRAGGEVITDNQ